MTMRSLFVMAACLVMLSCGLAENVVLADEAVAEFHERYNAVALDDMYDAAAAGIRQQQTRAEFAKAIGAIRDQLGLARGSQRTAFQTTAGSGGAFVQIEYQTEFEKGRAIEEFVWEVAQGKALLKGYTVTTQTLP